MHSLLVGLFSASLIFYADYNTGFDAVRSKGSPLCMVVADRYPPRLTSGGTGKFDEAAKFSYDTLNFDTVWTHDLLRYAAEGNIPFNTNEPFDITIGMWVNIDITELKGRQLIWLDPFHLLGPESAETGKLWMDFVTKELPGSPLLRFGATLPKSYRTNPRNNGEGNVIIVPDIGFARGEWHSLIGSWQRLNADDGSGVTRLYIDGKLAGEITGVSHPVKWNPGTVELRVGLAFKGYIDEIFVLDTFMNAEEADALFRCGIPIGSIISDTGTEH